MHVEQTTDGYRIVGGPPLDVEVVNAFLAQLRVRAFAGLTVRSYPFHALSFLRFCESRALQLMVVTPMDVCDFLEWLAAPPTIGTVVPLRPGRGAASSTMNQRIAALRGLFEFAVVSGAIDRNPVPSARRSSGMRAKRRGLLGHESTGRARRRAWSCRNRSWAHPGATRTGRCRPRSPPPEPFLCSQANVWCFDLPASPLPVHSPWQRRLGDQ